jgi:type I restriction enzyme S subunit
MTLSLDRSSWKRVAFGDVIESATDRVDDPSEAGVDRYVGLEHLDPGVMTVQRWDTPDKVEAQKLRFQPGDVIFGRRRAYQKKVALAEFEGICSAHALVLRARPDYIDPGFLPVFLSSDYFLDRAIEISVGSLSPTVNWRDLKAQEFDLPPLDEQKGIADLLWAIERHRRALDSSLGKLSEADVAWTREVLSTLAWKQELADVIRTDRPLCYGVVQPGVDVEDGVGLIRVLDLEGGSPDLASLKRVAVEIDAQYRRSRVEPGDVLLSIVGTIGRSWIVTDDFERCNIARALARISTDRTKMLPTFLQWVLSAADVQQTLSSAAFESARKTLNLSVLAKVQLPQLAVDEQLQLLSQRNRFSDASDSARAEASAARALRDSLLAEIFGGR